MADQNEDLLFVIVANETTTKTRKTADISERGEAGLESNTKYGATHGGHDAEEITGYIQKDLFLFS